MSESIIIDFSNNFNRNIHEPFDSPISDDGNMVNSENKMSIHDVSLKRSHSFIKSPSMPIKSREKNANIVDEITQKTQNLNIKSQSFNKPTPCQPEKKHPLCYLYRDDTNEVEKLHVYCESVPQEDDVVIYSRRFGNKTWKEFKSEYPQEESLEIWFPFFQWHLHHYELTKELEDFALIDSSSKQEEVKSPQNKLQPANEKRKPTTALNKSISSPAYGSNRRNARTSTVRSGTGQRLNPSNSRTPVSSRVVRRKPIKNLNPEPLVAEKRTKLSLSDRLHLEKYGCLTQEVMKRRFEVYIEKLNNGVA